MYILFYCNNLSDFYCIVFIYYFIYLVLLLNVTFLYFIALLCKNSDQLDSFPEINLFIVDLFVSVYVGKYCSLLVHINTKMLVI